MEYKLASHEIALHMLAEAIELYFNERSPFVVYQLAIDANKIFKRMIDNAVTQGEDLKDSYEIAAKAINQDRNYVYNILKNPRDALIHYKEGQDIALSDDDISGALMLGCVSADALNLKNHAVSIFRPWYHETFHRQGYEKYRLNNHLLFVGAGASTLKSMKSRALVALNEYRKLPVNLKGADISYKTIQSWSMP